MSFNCSKEIKSPQIKESKPSIGGWSPAQHIICATPRNDPIPTTPKDTANESYEKCSITKIQQSQKKLLCDLYGETWKSIPSLFKTLSNKNVDFDGVSKKLSFDEDEKENIRHDLKRNKELYLTSSDLKRNEINYIDSEKKLKKKLYTEKIPSTPDIKVKSRNVNNTTKKTTNGMSVTDLVGAMTDIIEQGSSSDKGLFPKKNGEKKIKNNTTNGTKTDLTGDIRNKFTNGIRNKDRVDGFTEKIEKACVTPTENGVTRLSFMGSLAGK